MHDMLSRDERVSALARELERLYPDTRAALQFSNPFELLVATILSAQATDRQVNAITPSLFKKFPTPARMAAARVEDIENTIRSINFFHTKARNIHAAAKMLVQQYGGTVPDSMKELIRLPGVARKTANVVLSQAFGKAEGIVVDTHVGRVARRLGLTGETNPIMIERDLMKILDRSLWISFPFRLIQHGRTVCTARKPACDTCALAHLCTYAQSREKIVQRYEENLNKN